MKNNSELTCTSAAKIGVNRPIAARPIPAASTRRVPAKLNRIIFLHRRDSSINSVSLRRSSPISRTPANSCAISVAEPTAIGTSATASAGVSLTPSPTIATICPSARIV